MWTLVRVDNAYHPQSTGVNSLLIITQNNCLWYSSSSNLLLTQYFEWTYHKSALAHHFVTVEKKSFPQDSIFDGINSAQRENFASFLASKDCTSREGSYALEPGSTRLKARTRPKYFQQDLEEDLQSVLEKNTIRPLAVLCEPRTRINIGNTMPISFWIWWPVECHHTKTLTENSHKLVHTQTLSGVLSSIKVRTYPNGDFSFI